MPGDGEAMLEGAYIYAKDVGWRLKNDQKYFLTMTPFWALTTCRDAGLTRGAPFDKIWGLCF